MARHNPYNLEQVMKRHKLSKADAQKKIDNLKERTSGSKSTYIKRYGKELGELKYKEFCEKSSHTKEKYIEKFGKDEGIKRWNEYLKTKDSTSLKFHIQKYGEKLGKIKYDERIDAIKQTLENMQSKYGTEEGLKRYNEMNQKRSYSCSTKGLTEKFGCERAQSINNSKSLPGKLNGMYGKPSPQGSGNGWSGWYKGQHFRSVLELSYMKHLNDMSIDFETAETKEYEVYYCKDGIERTYKPDFLVGSNVIEIKPHNLINTKENKLKFAAALNKFGDNFKILTEKDFEVISDISGMIESGEVILMERYHKKYLERKNNEN